MAELPASWDLQTKRRNDGKLDIIGRDDGGREYKVRTCDSGSIGERDVAEIASADRERYSSLDAGARAFVAGLVNEGKRRRLSAEARFQDELEEAAGPVVRAGLERERATTGYSRAYAKNFDRVFKEA